MTPERIETSLRFIGDWPWWAGACMALALGGAGFVLYRRDVRHSSRGMRVLLPLLRAVTIVLIVLMLSGPVLHHRKIIGELSQLFLVVDGSKSMELTDPSMDRTRKLAILQRLGLLPEGAAEPPVAPGSDGKSATSGAWAKFDAMPRWQRLQALLLESGDQKLLAQLSEKFDVQLLDSENVQTRKIWHPTGRDSSPLAALPKPSGESTNLASAIKSIAGAEAKARGAVVLFSDGQHNQGESPSEAAKIMAGRQMPIFTVGFGSEVPPRDLAIVKVETPEAVFFEDRARGQITLKDDMPVGKPFTIAIKDGDKVLWEQQLTTDGKNLRKIPFDFPVSERVKERLKGQSADVQMASVPLDLKVSISAVEGDRESANNEAALRVRALTQKRKILLLDGRPRWETRYLRNLFDRNEQWEINAVIANTIPGQTGWPRGAQPGTFPSDAALLATYDLIIFGETPRSIFKADELGWIKEFVEKRGGAIVLLDGPREWFRDYAATDLAALFPVEWKGASIRDTVTHLRPTERGSSLAAFTLAGDRMQNPELWRSLQPPRWMAGATALAGAETLVEADVGGRPLPAVVFRTFGAGKVLYHAFDESWRWRYQVADEHHVRYWNQVANWIAELPFASRDKFVSLDAGAMTYQPGDSAEIRVRLRDGEGRPVTDAVVEAVLTRDGKKVATLRLAADQNAGGLFRGRTAALEAGEYEVKVESVAIAERDSKARVQFKVQPSATGELVALGLNEELLRQMASISGGEYLREENIDRLPGLLAPMSEGRVVESDTVLWQSYWWFVPIIALLTAEWIVRKRVGML